MGNLNQPLSKHRAVPEDRISGIDKRVNNGEGNWISTDQVHLEPFGQHYEAIRGIRQPSGAIAYDYIPEVGYTED